MAQLVLEKNNGEKKGNDSSRTLSLPAQPW